VAVAYLIDRHAKFSVAAVAALTGFKEVEIVSELRRHIDSYPEQDWCRSTSSVTRISTGTSC